MFIQLICLLSMINISNGKSIESRLNRMANLPSVLGLRADTSNQDRIGIIDQNERKHRSVQASSNDFNNQMIVCFDTLFVIVFFLKFINNLMVSLFFKS